MQAFWFVFKATEIKIILFVAEGGAFACVLVKRPRLICRGCYLTVGFPVYMCLHSVSLSSLLKYMNMISV